MGIYGLLNYIRDHYKQDEFMTRLSPYLSDECVLIIDAPNLIHRFHANLQLDALCGGQYEELYQGLFDLFSTFRKSWPRLRVIMLQVEVTEGDKVQVMRSRKKQKLKRWINATEQAEPTSAISPCARDVLEEVVRVLGIETLCYDSEGDNYISALAMYYTQQGTPAFILSEDTDFYLTVGITGVLSLGDIVWSPGSRTRPVLKESRFFSLKDFLRTVYCLPWMIPFLAMLMGNDLTPVNLKRALEPIKTEYTSQGRGPSFARIVFYLARYAKTEDETLTSIRCSLKPHLHGVFFRTYVDIKKRYLSPLDTIAPVDVPTPRLKRMKFLFPGVSEQSLIRVAYFWNSKIGMPNNTAMIGEDYRQPRACLASLALRCYWHGVLLLPTQEGTGVKPPKYITEMFRQIDPIRCEGDTSTLGNIITDEQVEVFYKAGGIPLPSLSQVQELSKSDKLHFFLTVMHCSACHVLFTDTEFVNYEVSIVLSTLYYWYHQISFRERKSPSQAAPLSVPQRQELLGTLLNCALAVYFKDQLILPLLQAPNLRAVTRHECYHSVAEWICVQQDTNNLLVVLDLPKVSIRRSYNGYLLFRMITDREHSNKVSSLLSSLMGAELHNITEALLTPCSELK